MKPWILLDVAGIPGGGEMYLSQRGRDFTIRLGPNAELMNSGGAGSEKALAELGFARLGVRPAARVLIGGLGMGFTAAAALRCLPPDGHIVVAELVPAVVKWNRGVLAHLAGDPLSDPRVEVHVGDVAEVLRSSRQAFDLILLDVDNGPQAMTIVDNAWLYTPAGLTACYQALRVGGIVAVWSAITDSAFTQRLRQVGFIADVVEARSHGNRGQRNWIWFARRATQAQHAEKRLQKTARLQRRRRR
jgi:spermidine synthase